MLMACSQQHTDLFSWVEKQPHPTSTPPLRDLLHALHLLLLLPSVPWSPAPGPVQPSPRPTLAYPPASVSSLNFPNSWAKPKAWEMQVHMYWHQKKKKILPSHSF